MCSAILCSQPTTSSSVSKMTQNIKARIGAINGSVCQCVFLFVVVASAHFASAPSSYKATIVQHMPELKSVGSSASAAVSCAAAGAPPVDAAAADSIPDAFEADPAPDTSASFHNSSTSSVDSAAALSDVKTMFNVILKAKGVTPYQIIKEVRAITGLGLKEAQDFVESLPKPVKEGLSQDEATAIAAKLKAAGGDVEVD
jgi:large subunit ribosomal protein L7/L12